MSISSSFEESSTNSLKSGSYLEVAAYSIPLLEDGVASDEEYAIDVLLSLIPLLSEFLLVSC
jgi:hypothetical protein